MSLPEWYKEGITRVSSLVEHKFPFEGTNAQERYLGWLQKNWIKEEDYHREACDVGTFVHLQMENYIMNEPLYEEDFLYNKHVREIEAWIRFMKEYKLTDMQTEIYCCDEYNRYQGSIDLSAITADWKKVLIDWKTWGIAKKMFGLPNRTTKPYSKLKKVALQLSLYAKALWDIDEVWVVWLHEEGYFIYKLDMVPDNELEELILSHQTRNVDMPKDSNLIINYNPMQIKIQTTIPDQAYSVASVTLESADCDNGKTVEENIGTVIAYQKCLISKYKEANADK